MRFLTRSYVEWLGLEVVPIRKRPLGHRRCCFIEDGVLPPPGDSPYVRGVVYKGALYEREYDGLAFKRL